MLLEEIAQTIDEGSVGREVFQARTDSGSCNYKLPLSQYESSLQYISMENVRALLDSRKYSAVSALPLRSLFLLARSFRSKSRVEPFVDRSAMMRSALDGSLANVNAS